MSDKPKRGPKLGSKRDRPNKPGGGRPVASPTGEKRDHEIRAITASEYAFLSDALERYRQDVRDSIRDAQEEAA